MSRAQTPRGHRHVITDRTGGVSGGDFSSLNLASHVGDDPTAVAVNREHVATSLGVPGDRMIVLQAVSGGPVGLVDETNAGEVDGVEGMVTLTPGLALAVIAADCVPVLLADGQAGVVAVAHAGRRGTAAGIVPATLQAMLEVGATVEHVQVWLAPAICGACYEVGEQVQGEVAETVPASVSTTTWGTAGLDLRAGLRAQLAALGLRDDQVWQDPRCTLESDELYSYRRDGRTGRHGAGIVLEA